MNEREKLTELISDFLGYLPWGQIGSRTGEELAEYLLKNGVRLEQAVIEERKGWIRTCEKMPDNFVSVLGFMTDAWEFPAVRECYTVGNAFFFPALHDCHPVSHWMPLPEPPKEVGR